MSEIQVRPLEWERIIGDSFAGGATAIAQSVFGQYQVWGTGMWSNGSAYVVLRGSLDDGIAAAEADYETRVRSALILPPPPAA